MDVRFEKGSPLLKVDESLGLVFGWAAVFTKNGEEYFDSQGDAIDPEGAIEASLDFMKHSRLSRDLHQKDDGQVPFLMPITEDISKGLFGLDVPMTGIAIGMQPSKDVFTKFKSGEYTGFSIGGTRLEEEVVEKLAKRDDPKYRQGKRRRMKKFRLDEISAVDNPAQADALASLMKRDDKAAGFDKRAILTGVSNGHSHLLLIDPEDGTGARPHGETLGGGANFHTHPWVMDGEGRIVIGAADGHTHEPGVLSTNQEVAMSQLVNKREAEMPDNDKANEELVKRLEEAERLASMSDLQKSHYASLEGDAKEAYGARTAKDREKIAKAAVRKQEEANAVVYTDGLGQEYRKSDDPRLIALAKDRDADREANAELAKRIEEQSLAKRAAEFDHLPGTIEEKVEILKALQGNEAGEKLLKAANTSLAKFFKSVGRETATEEDGNAAATLEKRAREIAKSEEVSIAEARVMAEDENPELALEADGGRIDV